MTRTSQTTTTADVAAITTPAPDADAAITAPAAWFTGLSAEQQRAVRWVKLAALKLHPACDFLPRFERSYSAVRDSVARSGVLFPLAVDAEDRVLDGRYRYWAGEELNMDSMPVLTIDVASEDAVRWVYEMKDSREHLSEAERAVLAVQFQLKLKGEHTKVRAAKAGAARKLKGKTAVRHSAEPPTKAKQDSRREACDHFKVSLRKFRAIKKLADDRPDLYKQVLSGKLDPAAAIQRRGRNVDKARVEAALAAAVRPQDVNDGEIENRIHCGEAVDVLKRVADGVASLVLTSPPYFGANVDYDPPLPQQTYEQYLDGLRDVLAESFRVSRSGGRLALVLDTTHNPVPGGDEMLPIAADATDIARKLGWRYWTDIAWIKPEVGGSKTTFGSLGRCSCPGWGRDHEWILLFFKDQKKLDGDVALSDLSREEHQAWWRTTWRLNAETRRDILAAHPAPFSEPLAERLIKLLTYRRDLVIDPYNGSGTSIAVAKRLERRFIGIDRSANYCAFARQRVSAADARAVPEASLIQANSTPAPDPSVAAAAA